MNYQPDEKQEYFHESKYAVIRWRTGSPDKRIILTGISTIALISMAIPKEVNGVVFYYYIHCIINAVRWG